MPVSRIPGMCICTVCARYFQGKPGQKGGYCPVCIEASEAIRRALDAHNGRDDSDEAGEREAIHRARASGLRFMRGSR